jgi:hypothetical protein
MKSCAASLIADVQRLNPGSQQLGAEKFWTFDKHQAKLAKAVGLDVTP